MRFFETSEKTLMENSIDGVWSNGILSSSSCEQLLGTGSLISSIVPVSESQDILCMSQDVDCHAFYV